MDYIPFIRKCFDADVMKYFCVRPRVINASDVLNDFM